MSIEGIAAKDVAIMRQSLLKIIENLAVAEASS